jgi:hypothetical protein
MAAKEVSSGDSVADRESTSAALNGWPACVGISGRLGSDYALRTLDR